MSRSADYIKKVMDDLDALLADLQSTTAHISYNNQGPPPASQASPSPANQASPSPAQDSNLNYQSNPGYERISVTRPGYQATSTQGQGYQSSPGQGYQATSTQGQGYQSSPGPGYQATSTQGQGYQSSPGPGYQANSTQGQGYQSSPGSGYQTSSTQGQGYQSSGFQTQQGYQTSAGGRVSETPPPLPPPPQDLPEAIPPPQQFVDQPLYEAQNIVKRDSSNRVSSSSRSSAGSGDAQYYGRDIPQPGQPGYGRDPQYTSQPPGPPGNQPGMSMISNNLTELDQLLSDLNSAQFMAEVDKKHAQTAKQPPPPVAPKPSRGGGSSVDTLLDQLENSVPSPTSSQGGSQGGYPAQNNQVSYQSDREISQPQQGIQSGSVATQELDDLMATLSDFKMKDKTGPSVQAQVAPMRRSPSPGSEPSYAKPQKSRNLSQSSSANSSMQSSSMTGNMSSGSAQGGQLESMLGDLQSDLSSKGVNTKTKGLCAACNQPVVGQVITALGKIWHIEHFNCAQCHETLGTKNFYERDGMAYCERDYHSLFAPRCSYCNGPIIDKCVTALNATWHPEHFFCAQCGRPFGDDGFHEKDGKAYCKADFFEMFAPKCGGCGRAIVNNYISGLNRHWHPECFACWECHQPFNGGSFFDYEGLPYCETHYHQKRGSLCAGCQKPIAGRCITAMYKKFHPEHFVCAFCLKQLNKGTFKEHNDRPYCHPCFVKLFG